MDINEFEELGYLQELNRLFLHPLGLSLLVKADTKPGGIIEIAGIADNRNDPEGMAFGTFGEYDKIKAEFVEAELQKRIKVRGEKYGWVNGIEPIVVLTDLEMTK